MHVFWEGSPTNAHAAETTLRIPQYPAATALYFFALQVSFVGEGGRRYGAGHLGLQWHPAHPGNTAVNWGGYEASGRELQGSASPLPSATSNPNTRDFAWTHGRPYRLRIERVSDGWQGTIVDVESDHHTIVRTLFANGTRISDPMVWTESFAPCDAPSASVEWSDFRAEAPARSVPVTRGRAHYQSFADGGCTNTSTHQRADGTWVQRTNTVRV